MKNRWYSWTIGLLGVALLATAFWGYTQWKEKAGLLLRTEGNYQRSFFQLVDNVERLEVALSKAMVNNSPKQAELIFTEIWRQAFAAQQNLGELPLNQTPLVKTEKFLAQVGDFSYSLAQKEEAGSLSAQEWNNLRTLHQKAVFLGQELQKIYRQIGDEKFPWTKKAGPPSKELESGSDRVVVDGFTNVEEELQDYPTLIYDGPFAEQNLAIVPKKLPGRKISRDEAIGLARKFLGLNTGAKLKVVEAEDAAVPSYVIQTVAGSKPGAGFVAVTKQGGHVAWMIIDRAPGAVRLNLKEAQAKAEQFIGDKGYKDFRPTGVMKNDTEAVVSFVRIQDNVSIYPEQVKVKVALDNGQVVGFEATQFLLKKEERRLPKPKITVEEAREKISPRLEIKKQQMAIIPLPNGKEPYCYEFFGSLEGMNFLVYINAMTGEEEQVLRIVPTKEGLLTM